MIGDERNDQFWFVKDVCGIFCCIFSWILLAYAEYAVITCVILPERNTFYKTVNLVVFQTLLILSTVSHYKCVFTDPGSVPRGSATREAIESIGMDEEDVVYKCNECFSIKPKRAHHCRVCKRCIVKMDHHCPWINNCVALRNQKFFMLFTMYISLISYYVLVITVLHLVNCLKNDWSYCDSRPLLSVFTDYYSPLDPKLSHASAYSIVVNLLLIIKAIVFGIFTSTMFAVQAQSIYRDETGIESLKKRKYRIGCTKNRSFSKRFRDMLSGFELNWLNPFTSPTLVTSLDFKSYTTHYV